MAPDVRPMIELERVSRWFEADRAAVDDVSLGVAPGEFFSLLGPSGCGKTTSLRMIAGFEAPDAGRILIDGEDCTDVPAKSRAVHMVFQDYALFPHMTVAENVAFGLRLKKLPRAEITERVAAALQSMQLEGMPERRPAQLSGGQRQRVALARALVNRPAALLLDEPLGALDLKLRKEMQLELKALQQRTRTTFVYVTHDQEEALTMSDRIAVMSEGRVEQVAAPKELYERPATRFVADFIGVSNTLSIKVDRRDAGRVSMELGDGRRLVAPDPGDGRDVVEITVRPEKIKLDPAPGRDRECRMEARVLETVYLGSTTQVVLAAETGDRVVVHMLNDEPLAPTVVRGADVTVAWAAEHSYVLGEPAVAVPETAPPGFEQWTRTFEEFQAG
jgi:spermidine/putrescine transport system ATP-binding protein